MNLEEAATTGSEQGHKVSSAAAVPTSREA
jgi:hypothetical protein